MERNITSEANIKDDRYYLGIATKAYKIVQDTLKKYKGNIKKRNGEFEGGPPFHKADKMMGWVMSGSDMLKPDFPGLSTLAFAFISNKARGGQKIKGGFSGQTVILAGKKHKGVLVMANLIAPFDPKHMDTRLDKNTFIHEFIHYLDQTRYRQQHGIVAKSAKYLDAGDYAGYYNTPSEFNAYFQEGQRSVIDIFKFIPEETVAKFLDDFKEFQKVAYSRKWNHFQEDFIKYLDSKYKKKFLKRLYNLYEFLRKEFFSNDNSLKHITEGTKIKINSDSVKKWAGDLRKLTKAYKSIGDSEDDPATLKRYDKIRRAFTVFGNNFEKWVYKFFLQYNWQGSLQGETWEAKEVREKAWVAVTSLMGNFPEAWDYVEKKHKPSPQLLVRYREKTIRRYRTAFREGIKAMLDYIGIHGDQERLPPTEQANIGPIKLIIHNHAREGGSERGEEGRERSLKHITTNIKSWAGRIKKAGFGKVLDRLIIDLDFRISNDAGEMVAGEYHMNKDMLFLYGAGMQESTFVHELGHRFWYRELPSNARNHWVNVIDKRKIKIERPHIKDFVDKYFNDYGTANYGRKKAMKMIDKLEDNPETIAIYKTLHSGIPFAKTKKELFQRYADRWAGKDIPLEHISDYGRTNAQEAFAEAFKLYILLGPKKLKPWTLWFFKEIVRTGGASINEMKIQEVSMSARPKTGAQVSKMLKAKGFPGVKVQKDRSTKHYYFAAGIAGFFYDATIMDYDLRVSDFTYKQWWKEFHTMYLDNSIPAEEFLNKKLFPKHNKDTKHPDMKYLKDLKEHKMINEVTLTKETIKEFVKFASDALELKNKVSLKLLNKRTDEMTAACYNPQTNEISIYIKERAFADVCRSIAHELVHQKQNELGILEADSGQTGSDIENEANSCAGIIMRNYGDVVENLYN